MATAYGSREATYTSVEPDVQKTSKAGSKWTPYNLMSRFAASLPSTPTHLPQQKGYARVDPEPSSKNAAPLTSGALSKSLHEAPPQEPIAAEPNQTCASPAESERPQIATEAGDQVNALDQSLGIKTSPLEEVRGQFGPHTPAPEAAQLSTSPLAPLGTTSGDLSAHQHVSNASHVTATSPKVAPRSSFLASSAKINDLNATHVTFSAEKCEMLDKKTFIAWQCSKPPVLVEQWENTVRPRLEDNLIAVMAGIGLRSNHILCRTQFEMVGPIRRESGCVTPTVIITCGSRKCKHEMQKVLSAGQFQCLTDFGQSVVIRFKAAPKWYTGFRLPSQNKTHWFIDAHTPRGAAPSVVPSQKEFRRNSDPHHPATWRTRRIYIEDLSLVDTSCGLSLRYESTNSDDRLSYSILGGLITIDGVIYGLTSAHPLLLDLDDNSDADSIGSDSDAESGVSADDDSMPGVSLEAVPQKPLGKGIHTRTSFDHHQVQAKSSWIGIGRDGACSFAGWGAAMSPSMPGTFQNARRSANSDWTVIRADSMAGKRNSYRPAQEDPSDGAVEEVTISAFAQSLDAGKVHIVWHGGVEAATGYLTQTTNSLFIRESSLQVRQVYTQVVLGPGISGSWVVRGSDLLGFIVAGEPNSNSTFMLPIKDVLRSIKEFLGARDVHVYLGHSDVPSGGATSLTSDVNRQHGLPSPPDWPDGTGGEGETVDENVLHFEGSNRCSVPRRNLPHSQPSTRDVSYTSHLQPSSEARRDAEPSGERSRSAWFLGGFSKNAAMNTKRSHVAANGDRISGFQRVAQYLTQGGPLRPYGLVFILVLTMIFATGELVMLLRLASSVSDLQHDLDYNRQKLNGTIAFLNSTLSAAYVNTLNESVELPNDAWIADNGVPVIEPQYLEYIDHSANQLQLSFDLRHETAPYDVCHCSSNSNLTNGKPPGASLVVVILAAGVTIALLFICLSVAGYQLLWHMKSEKGSQGQRSSSRAPSHKMWFWRLLDPVMRLTRRYSRHQKDEHLAPLIPLTEVTDEGYGGSRTTTADVESRWTTID